MARAEAWARGLIALVLLGIAGSAHGQATSPAPQPSAKHPEVGAGANISAYDFARGARDAPALLKTAGITCKLTDAADLGASTVRDAKNKYVETVDLYEIACAEGPGYFIYTQAKKPPVAIDCIEAVRSGHIACMLFGNRHPATGLDPYLKMAGAKCTTQRARFIDQDSTSKVRRYEVACDYGGGYILATPLMDGSGPAPVAVDCLQAEALCSFTPHVESVAMLAHRVGEALGAGCHVSDARYVGYIEATKRDMYELACQAGHDGVLVELDDKGAVQHSRGCKETKLVGGACQLKAADTVDPLIYHAQMSGASPPVLVTNPDWLRKPSGSELVSLYPSKAMMYRLSGQATISCRSMLSGALKDCFVIDESPMGFGFGDAALKMSASFRMKPATIDGVAIDGEHVTIPINFALR